MITCNLIQSNPMWLIHWLWVTLFWLNLCRHDVSCCDQNVFLWNWLTFEFWLWHCLLACLFVCLWENDARSRIAFATCHIGVITTTLIIESPRHWPLVWYVNFHIIVSNSWFAGVGKILIGAQLLADCHPCTTNAPSVQCSSGHPARRARKHRLTGTNVKCIPARPYI